MFAFPLGDDNPTKHAPVMTWLVIAANVAVFVLFKLSMPEPQVDRWVLRWGFDADHPFSVQIFTSMFMHGGVAHILGNMWMLWIVGNNVEDKVGKLGFLALYLLGGCAAALSYDVIERLAPPNEAYLQRFGQAHPPLVGASGAIAAVMGIYLVFFPEARVRVFFWWFLIVRVIPVRAKWFIGLSLLADLAASILAQGAASGGVATMAHVGGGLFGIVTALAIKPLVGGGREGDAWDVHTGFSKRPSPEAQEWIDSQLPPVAREPLDGPDEADLVHVEEMLTSLVRSGRMREAIDVYPVYVAHRREKPLPPDVQIEIAHEFYRQWLPKYAVPAYMRYLDTWPDGDDAAEAKFRLGVLHARGTGDRAAAVKWLTEAANEHRDPQIVAAARQLLAQLGA